MPVFFYTANVPPANQSKNVSQPIMLANFQAIPELITVDHVGFNNNNEGRHNQVTLVPQAVIPPTAWGANFNGIFCAVDPNTNTQETYLHNQSANGPYDLPFTESIFSTTTIPNPVTMVGQGWCYLPADLIVKWGTFTTASANPYVFPTTASTGKYIPPFTTAVLSFQISVVNTAGSTTINSGNITRLNFNWSAAGSAPASFSYLAIGY